MKMKETQLLRETIRQLILEREKYVYHISPNKDIAEFEPRPFIHNADYTESGAWVGDEPPPPGFNLTQVVFAAHRRGTPFYSLPRDTPRIEIRLHDIDPEQLADVEALLGAKVTQKTLVLPAAERGEIEAHTWAEYAFDRADFTPLPGNTELIATKRVKPIFKKVRKNPLRFIKSMGYTIAFVDDISALHKQLQDIGIDFSAEGL